MSIKHQCCGADAEGNHASDCPMVAGVNESYKQDGARIMYSLTHQSASAIRKRVLAAQSTNGDGNGHPNEIERVTKAMIDLGKSIPPPYKPKGYDE